MRTIKIAKELSSLKERINKILVKTESTENILRKEKNISTYNQKIRLKKY